MTAYSTTDANILLTLGFVGGEKKMTDANFAEKASAYSRLRLRAISAGLAIAGIAIDALSVNIGTYVWAWVESVAREFGAALIVAAVIGGTVDLFFKDEFARDAFVAAFRYVLPAELREEALRIISYKFMCTESRMIVRLEPISATDLVRVHISMERTIRNISGSPETVSVGLALDDWGFHGQAPAVEECEFNIGNGWQSCPDEPHDDPAVEKINRNILIRAGQTYKAAMKGYEIHRENDALRMFLINPAINPSVELHMPPDFKGGCTFGVPNEKINVSKIDSHYRLEGTQFPGQCTYIRWWRTKSDTAA